MLINVFSVKGYERWRNFGERASVLKNPFALSSAPSPGAKYDVSVVF